MIDLKIEGYSAKIENSNLIFTEKTTPQWLVLLTKSILDWPVKPLGYFPDPDYRSIEQLGERAPYLSISNVVSSVKLATDGTIY